LDFYCYVDSSELRVTHIFRLPKDERGGEVDITADSSHELPWGRFVTDPINEYDPELRGVKELKVPKPLHVSQPNGPSFTVDGNRVCCMGWDFSVGFNYVGIHHLDLPSILIVSRE
jgi:primary-amine oxidase